VNEEFPLALSDRGRGIFVLSKKTIFFSDYRQHTDATINPSLIWEYNMDDFDFQAMKQVVVQRVVERGWPNDWYAALNLPYLNDKDMYFVSALFQIPLSELTCYTRKQSRLAHWNS
jgi:hypothetical protein